MGLNDIHSLSHTKWNCKYHITRLTCLRGTEGYARISKTTRWAGGCFLSLLGVQLVYICREKKWTISFCGAIKKGINSKG